MGQQREVQYLGRDYASLKNQLSQFVQIYFPDDWQDFSGNSPSMALLELSAYTGDVLSYYQDNNFNEVFLERAKEFKNIVAAAKNLTYKYRGKKPSYGKIDITCNFSVSGDYSIYGFVLKAGTQFSTKISPLIIFETLYDIDFSVVDSNTVTIYDAKNYWVTKKNIDIVSGTSRSFTTTVGAPEKFYKIKLPEVNIFNINSVVDADNNRYYQVESLSQDVIMRSVINYASTSGDVANNLLLKYVPRRFKNDVDGFGNTVLTFGSGINNVKEFDFIPSPEDYTLNAALIGKTEIPFSNIMVENFMNTSSLGYAPNNTTLTIKYQIGGGKDTNVGVGKITKLIKGLYTAKNDALQGQPRMNSIINSLTSYNVEETSGGNEADTYSDIKYIAPKWFAAQGKMSSLQDFIATSKSMPTNFGSVYRSTAKVSSEINNTVELYILSKTESNGVKNFQFPNSALINNVKNYMKNYRSFNDNIIIRSANIIDIGLEYNLRIDSYYSNANEIVANTLFALKDYFDIANWDIEQPIYLARISNIITNVKGVLAVYNLNVVKKSNGYEGRVYNDNPNFDITKNIQRGTVLCPPNSVYQCHYPYYDINSSFETQ